ncbi:phosphatidylinositol 4-kinase gamma 4-like [Lycium ferocissimum]|uniref:phosphatidylinositol 4-kinase gamma 4-like n=1 Tax=Lycium ferocissimum TaxID=112874 RepID=UPI0028165605|nr:phosphatidylinositol 4-kinase gamma 4-like [Lycium ferocissimum]
MSAGVVAISPVCLDKVVIPSVHSQESILIYVAMSGSMMPLSVLEYDSIEFVKLQIQSCKGFVVKNQKLVCRGRELSRKNSLIRDYGVSDGNVVHLVLRLSDLQVINVTTCSGEEFTFNVERSRDVGYVKRQLAEKKDSLRDVDEQEVLCKGERLEDRRIIHDLCKNNDAVIHLFVRKNAKIRARPLDKNFELSIVAPHRNDDVVRENRSGNETDHKVLVPREPPDREIFLEPVIVNPRIEIPEVLRDLIVSTFEGLDRGNYPIRSSEGTGGAYFMRDASGNKFVSVFKPIDEEPMAVNNPQGLPLSVNGEGLKKGTRVGEGGLRECAAYILDHPKSGRHSLAGETSGFAGVPPTAFVRCLHKGFNHPDGVKVKLGSLQKFMENNGSCEDLGPNAFPVEEVHKIAVLDMRLANADRHAGNILMSKGENGQIVLIPIDHGYCLPDSFEDVTFDWLYWPQARQPFSSETIEYIKSLDAEEDIGLLEFYGWDISLETARTLRISTMLLKKGVHRGLTPFTIGSIMCRENLNKESVIEKIFQEALDSMLPGSSEDSFLESVSHVMDRCLDEIA